MARTLGLVDLPDAVRALADPVVVAVLRVLAVSGPSGKLAIVTQAGSSPTTVTAKLALLERVGLVTVSRETGQRLGRRVVYDADREAVAAAADAQRAYLLGEA